MIFVDTGVWFARFVADDPDHERVVQWFASCSERLITSDYCVDETLTLLAARKRSQLALAAGARLFDESLALHFLTGSQITRAWLLFQQRAPAGWSFTDCTSRIVIADFGISSAAALDGHFQQFGVQVVP